MTNNVANVILAQLGGSRFVAMTGSKDFVGSDRSLRFKVGRGAKNGITHVVVKLKADDTYSVEASKFSPRSLQIKVVDTRDMVQAEGLPAVFSAITGMFTSL